MRDNDEKEFGWFELKGFPMQVRAVLLSNAPSQPLRYRSSPKPFRRYFYLQGHMTSIALLLWDAFENGTRGCSIAVLHMELS